MTGTVEDDPAASRLGPHSDSGEVALAEIDRRVAHAKAKDAETDSGLRQVLGYGVVGLMAAQIATADVVFVLYAANNGWDIPVVAINVWLGAAVVQVVALAHTVARYLFPSNGGTAPDGADT